MAEPIKILEDALSLKPVQRAELVDRLLISLDETNPEIDALWAEEAEKRIEAYEQGNIQAIPLEQVLSKYRRV